MENNKQLYTQYETQKRLEKDIPEFDLIKFMETYKKSVDFYNSYGFSKKVPTKKVLQNNNA